MVLSTDVSVGDPHPELHNEEREAINELLLAEAGRGEPYDTDWIDITPDLLPDAGVPQVVVARRWTAGAIDRVAVVINRPGVELSGLSVVASLLGSTLPLGFGPDTSNQRFTPQGFVVLTDDPVIATGHLTLSASGEFLSATSSSDNLVLNYGVLSSYLEFSTLQPRPIFDPV